MIAECVTLISKKMLMKNNLFVRESLLLANTQNNKELSNAEEMNNITYLSRENLLLIVIETQESNTSLNSSMRE